MTTQAENHDTKPNVLLIWKDQLDGWIEDQPDKKDLVQAIWECVLCGENTCMGDGAEEGPVAFIFLKDHRAFLTVCVHCVDRDDDGQDVLDRCEAVVCGNRCGSTH